VKRSSVTRIIVYLLVPFLAWLAFSYRMRIETLIWHLRHGQSDVFAKYVVPAPSNWYVEDSDAQIHTLIRLDTHDRSGDPRRDRKRRAHATIMLSTHPLMKMEGWLSLRSSMLRKDGIDPVVRTFDLDGETMSCVGGERFEQMLKSPRFFESDPNTWDCWSSGWLEMQIMATDADMDDVWKIVSQIRKQS
jgi:hypothetical protein